MILGMRCTKEGDFRMAAAAMTRRRRRGGGAAAARRWCRGGAVEANFSIILDDCAI